MSFEFFLFSLFIIGCGLTCLETAANPYITVLGDLKYGASRLNLAQSFNGLGWILGPLVGGMALFSTNADVSIPYIIIGSVVLLVAFFFMRIRLPEIKEEEPSTDAAVLNKGLWQHAHFLWGVIALFCYVAAQTGINSFFINYVTESDLQVNNATAALLLSFGGMGLFMLGRFLGSWLMNLVRAEKLLFYFAVGASVCMVIVIGNWGWLSVGGLFICYLFESIMFPTLFALSIVRLGHHTKRASSFLIMAIVGGAVAPVLMGLIGENNMAIGFIVPLICFLVIGIYAMAYKRMTRFS